MMNRFLRGLAIFLLGGFMSVGLLSIGLVQADEHPLLQLAAGASDQPDNGAIRRANPNSRQGTESISPSMRGPNLGPSQSRPPTLENGGIRNGYPTHEVPRVQTVRPSTNGTQRPSN
jgi:hypothetical protein